MSSYVLINRDDLTIMRENLEALKLELIVLLENAEEIYEINEKLTEAINLHDLGLPTVYIHPSNRPHSLKPWQKNVSKDIDDCLKSIKKALTSNFIETLFPDAS